MDTLTKNARTILKLLIEGEKTVFTNKELSEITKLSVKQINSAVTFLSGSGAIEIETSSADGEYTFNTLKEGIYAEAYYEQFNQDDAPTEIKINLETLKEENGLNKIDERGLNFQHYLTELDKLINSYIKVSDGILLKTEDSAYYKQLLVEMTDFLDEIFGEQNKYSSNVFSAANKGFGGFYGGPSKASILDVKAMLNASFKKYIKSRKNIREEIPLAKFEPFVDISRINSLKRIKNEKYDLSKLIQLCLELNIARDNNCFLSLTMLVRAIIDHIPPFFGFTNFSEFTNNYNNGKSFKALMERLNTASRKIADSYLHKHISKKESLPNFTQVNFSTELDVLLAEIINVLSKDVK